MRWTQVGAAGVMGIALSAGCAVPARPPAVPPAPVRAAPPLPSPDATPGPASAGSEPEDGDVALEYSLGAGALADCMDETQFRAVSGLTRTELFAPPGAKARHVAR